MRGRVQPAIMYLEYGLSSIHATIFQNRAGDRPNLHPNPRNAITGAISRCSVKVAAIYERPIKSGISRAKREGQRKRRRGCVGGGGGGRERRGGDSLSRRFNYGGEREPSGDGCRVKKYFATRNKRMFNHLIGQIAVRDAKSPKSAGKSNSTII